MESLFLNPFETPGFLRLTNSVGRGGANLRDDVIRTFKAFFHLHPLWGGVDPERWDIEEKCTPRLIKAIEKFQRWNFGGKKASGLIKQNSATHAKITQILLGAIDIVAASAGGGVLQSARAMTEGELVVSSVENMVTQVLDRLHAGYHPKKIMSLVLVGHGIPGSITLGPKKIWGLTTITLENVIADTPDPANRHKLHGQAEQELIRLRGHFHSNAVITLASCRAATEFTYDINQRTKKAIADRPIDGKDFLKAISKAVGNVWVQGGDEKQRVSTLGMDGNCIRCNSGACYVVVGPGDGWWGDVHGVELLPY
jgi:hypothetical protein